MPKWSLWMPIVKRVCAISSWPGQRWMTQQRGAPLWGICTVIPATFTWWRWALLTAPHAKWAFAATSQPKEGKWAAIVCEIREGSAGNNGEETHIVTKWKKYQTHIRCKISQEITSEERNVDPNFGQFNLSLITAFPYIFDLVMFSVGFFMWFSSLSICSFVSTHHFLRLHSKCRLSPEFADRII